MIRNNTFKPFIFLSQIEENEDEIEEENGEEVKEKENNLKKCIESEKCEECNEESLSNDLCIKCNNEKGYYHLNSSFFKNNENFIDCVNDNTKPINFYFNEKNKNYEECFQSCKTCDKGGNKSENNCTLCEDNYIIEPDIVNSSNCVPKCIYFYYYNFYEEYKCTYIPLCVEEENLLVIEKRKCIDNCRNDNIYKYQYDGICLKECPIHTKIDCSEFNICKDINLDKCTINENKLFLNENITRNEIKFMVNNYVKEFQYTINHISIIKNNIYAITIYKNNECLSQLPLEESDKDFGECYRQLINNNTNKDNLITVIINKKINNTFEYNIISYPIYEWLTEEFNILCENSNNIIKINNTNLEEVINNLPILIEEIEIWKNYELKGEDFNLEIFPINSSRAISKYINFSECENILRHENKISTNRILTFIRLEIEVNNETVLNNQIEYAVFNDEKKC